jgi:hypothetical protein
MTTKTINFSKYSSIKIGGEHEVAVMEAKSFKLHRRDDYSFVRLIIEI